MKKYVIILTRMYERVVKPMKLLQEIGSAIAK